MADKKLNEVTKVTDMAYVPVIMSDGSVGQIAKADLASVVAEVIIPWKGVSTSATGLDELIELISLEAPRGFLRFATSWTGHSNGYSGFCSRAGYGTQEGDTDRISGVIFVSSDAVYAFVADIKLDTRAVSNIKKAEIAWI